MKTRWRRSLFARAPADLLRPSRLWAALLFGVFLIFALASPPASAAEESAPPDWKEIRIASEGARPPYNYLDNNNELAGFEIDLARDLCARMKANCSFVAQDWDGLIPGLLEHQYDAIMAAMEITDEAREKIAFAKPYIRMPSAFMASRENMIEDASPAGLAGKSIGVESGGAHQAYVEDLYKQSEIHSYATLEEAILDLAEGRLDVVIGDKDALADFLKTRREAQCCALAADVPRDPAYFGDGIGIGLRQQDRTLKAMFEKALDESVADGAFARIRAKYFDFEIN
ncbi:transporter substrate-binding domain-containing protein [Methylocapsa polymorpha]|uniref:Transporter substrate-binding domain-containing protein n=1 Tax=Methylocapsa polymorpha TaxID=3080828 RepID=A0ABZ0HSV9_9HYPH|nr:transporter substrate-binding domain-containing protein [Methylocapsa sp. RX1]